jgi:hypothetical protein
MIEIAGTRCRGRNCLMFPRSHASWGQATWIEVLIAGLLIDEDRRDEA